METQKIVNSLADADNESSKFATRKWYFINDQKNTDYGEGKESGTTVKFETKVIKSNLWDYSDVYVLVTGNITATDGNANTRVAFKNCAPFTKCITHINAGSLWPFERDESPLTNDGNPDNVSVNNSTYFKYKSSLIGESTAANNNNRVFKNVEIAVPRKYLSNFWIFKEILLVNCKIHLELTGLKVV